MLFFGLFFVCSSQISKINNLNELIPKESSQNHQIDFKNHKIEPNLKWLKINLTENTHAHTGTCSGRRTELKASFRLENKQQTRERLEGEHTDEREKREFKRV